MLNQLPSWKGATATLLLCTAVLAAGCATTGVNRGDLNVVSLEEEWQLGQQLERDLAQRLQLVRDPVVNQYVQRLGQQIVSQTELANVPWEFHVVADPSLNAFNIPGGHVYLHTGMIQAAGNAAELAGVMAHEVAHGVSRHATERLSKAQGLNFAAGLLLGQNPAVYEQILAQIVGTGAIAKFSRSDEREADELGIRYMIGAGYNPTGMADMFEKLMRQSGSSGGGFFSTHPHTADRLADARQHASRLSRPGLVTTDNRLAEVQRRLRGYSNR